LPLGNQLSVLFSKTIIQKRQFFNAFSWGLAPKENVNKNNKVNFRNYEKAEKE